MKRAVVVFSGGIDSVCSAAYLKDYELYGISFYYGQRAEREIRIAKEFSRIMNLKEHKVADIRFMGDLYSRTNVLTDAEQKMPQRFEYSIVVPIRNAIFLSIATAWAYTLDASLVAYGAHTGDKNYPDCRPEFGKKIEAAFNEGEHDGIKSGLRRRIRIWSPFMEGLSKTSLLKIGYEKLGEEIFRTWSCYLNGTMHCGICESCNNRRSAFEDAKITDRTKYQK